VTGRADNVIAPLLRQAAHVRYGPPAPLLSPEALELARAHLQRSLMAGEELAPSGLVKVCECGRRGAVFPLLRGGRPTAEVAIAWEGMPGAHTMRLSHALHPRKPGTPTVKQHRDSC
jgi:hypothetical protein